MPERLHAGMMLNCVNDHALTQIRLPTEALLRSIVLAEELMVDCIESEMRFTSTISF